MMFIQIFILTLFSCGFAQKLYINTPNVHPSLTGSFFQAMGDLQHQKANAVDNIINKIKPGGGKVHTVPGDILRGFGNLKYRLADAADNILRPIKNNGGRRKSLFGHILPDLFHHKYTTEQNHPSQPSPSLSSSPPSIIYVYPPATYLSDNTVYPYPDIKKPSSPGFFFIGDGKVSKVTIDGMIEAGKYLANVKKLAINDEVNI